MDGCGGEAQCFGRHLSLSGGGDGGSHHYSGPRASPGVCTVQTLLHCGEIRRESGCANDEKYSGEILSEWVSGGNLPRLVKNN